MHFSCWGIILRLFLRRFQRFESFKRLQNKESFPKISGFVFEIKLLFFLNEFLWSLTWWFSRDQAEEIEADWELRKDKFYSESAASGYTNEALNLSIDDFGKKINKGLELLSVPSLDRFNLFLTLMPIYFFTWNSF